MGYFGVVIQFLEAEEKRGLSPVPNLEDADLLQSSFLNFVKPTSRLWPALSTDIQVLECSHDRIEVGHP